MTKIFISGSITIQKIDEQIKTRLDNIINQNHIVLIGDANGADRAVQAYLAEKKYSKVTIYCSGQTCRNNIGNWQVVNVAVPSNARGRNFYMVKDKQMAIDSDYGFMLWDGKSAGTLNNLLNLITNDKTGLIYLFFKKSFNTIKDITSFEDFINQCNQNDIDIINKKISFRQKLASYNQPVQEQLFFDVVKEEPATSYNTPCIKTAKRKVSDLLDQNIIANKDQLLVKKPQAEYQIIQKGETWDLSKINFDKLKEDFNKKKYKNIEIANLRTFIEDKIDKMIEQNKTRTDFAQKLQEIIDNYNSGGSSNENYYEDLVNFAEDLKKEDERHIREGLTEDELELFDILKKNKMTRKETMKVKLAAKALIHRLVEEHPRVLIQGWYKDTQSQTRVKSTVEEVLDKTLPDSYDKKIFKDKCNTVFEMIYEYAAKGLKWAA